MRTVPRRGTGPVLHKRIKEGKAALRKTRTIPGGFDRKATVAAVMIVAATLFGVELADVAPRDVSSLELPIMTAICGPSRPCRAKEGVFALLLPGHRVAPSMVVPYKRMCWLAHIARVPGTVQIVTQAVWEHTEEPKGTGPLGRALREFRRLGWRNQRGWWSWTMPRTGISVHLVHAPKEYVEHLVLEGASPGGTGETETHTERTGALRHGAGQVDAARRDGGGAVDRGQSASERSASGWQLPLL